MSHLIARLLPTACMAPIPLPHVAPECVCAPTHRTHSHLHPHLQDTGMFTVCLKLKDTIMSVRGELTASVTASITQEGSTSVTTTHTSKLPVSKQRFPTPTFSLRELAYNSQPLKPISVSAIHLLTNTTPSMCFADRRFQPAPGGERRVRPPAPHAARIKPLDSVCGGSLVLSRLRQTFTVSRPVLKHHN